MEQTSSDEALRHAVQNVANQLLRDVDLYKNSACILIQLQIGIIIITIILGH